MSMLRNRGGSCGHRAVGGDPYHHVISLFYDKNEILSPPPPPAHRILSRDEVGEWNLETDKL